jgi:hypothetical protein
MQEGQQGQHWNSLPRDHVSEEAQGAVAGSQSRCRHHHHHHHHQQQQLCPRSQTSRMPHPQPECLALDLCHTRF